MKFGKAAEWCHKNEDKIVSRDGNKMRYHNYILEFSKNGKVWESKITNWDLSGNWTPVKKWTSCTPHEALEHYLTGGEVRFIDDEGTVKNPDSCDTYVTLAKMDDLSWEIS